MAPRLHLPTTYLLPTHLSDEERLKLEAQIPNLTYDITEAKLVLGKINTARRAEFELKSRGILAQKVEPGSVKKEDAAKKEKVQVKREVNERPAKIKRRTSSDEEKVKIKQESQDRTSLKHVRSDGPPGRKPKRRKLGQIGGGDSDSASTTESESEVEIKKEGQKRQPKIDDGKGKTVEEAVVIDSSTESEGEKVTQSSRRTDSPPNHLPSPKSEATSQDGKEKPLQRESSTLSKTANEDSDSDGPREFINWDTGTIRIVKLAWFETSLQKGYMIPLTPYLVYEGLPTIKPETQTQSSSQLEIPSHPYPRRTSPEASRILERAKADPPPKAPYIPYGQGHPKFDPSTHTSTSVTRPTHLLHETTSEHDTTNLPPLPDYLHNTYSCTRPTPLHPPNEEFIKLLKKIRQSRVLTDDEIGVRAYSSAIASIAAYPYPIRSRLEILRLPVCSEKIAALWAEWKEYGKLTAVEEIKNNPDLQILETFYNIWGVGAKGARDFYYKKGWRDLDDIVEFGWNSLSRVQQIGVKYYEEFLDPIPRDEVESIGATILKAANKVARGAQLTIVGGHRRGKEASGDVDVVVSHPSPDDSTTSYMVTRIVGVLENQGWITHTLLLSTANSERNQTPVSYRGEHTGPSTGFDTLDKALVVWQDPNWATKAADLAANPKAKNPNPHRRVDIILSPWRTVGCATAGWTSGTTFQRDLRRWAKDKKELKFDSSGIRSRHDGSWCDFESVGGVSKTMLEAEKKVFVGLGLEWREPGERCTG